MRRTMIAVLAIAAVAFAMSVFGGVSQAQTEPSSVERIDLAASANYRANH